MSQAPPTLYEAFVDAGFKPADAYRIEQAILGSQNKAVDQFLDDGLVHQDALLLQQEQREREQRLECKLGSLSTNLLIAIVMATGIILMFMTVVQKLH